VYPGSAEGVGYLWSFEELLGWSDIAVIAEHIGGHDTGNRSVSPRTGLVRVERVSEFAVLVQLKAEPGRSLTPGATVSVRHWWNDFHQWQENHPGLGLLSSGSDPREVQFTQGKGPYVLFLKRIAEDRFEPVTHNSGSPVDWAFMLRGPGAPAGGEIHYHGPTVR
jgi:hypothetical protein